MEQRLIRTLTVILLMFGMNQVYAGFLKFPVPQSGYTPSTVPITAVMDHDSDWNKIKTRTGETGSYANGCLAYVSGNVSCTSSNTSYPWAYKRPGGAAWSTPGINYIDLAPGNNVWMWYDNHHGYDFSVSQWLPVVSAESGTVTDINTSWGQVTITHSNGYRTTYTHMYLNLPMPQTVSKGQHIGWVSNVAPSSQAVGVHLHFVVERNTGGHWYQVDPYGGSGEPVLWD
ncbi:hypothetical protein A3C89_03580 [Candidatus Kaiserbacteria bacterium RIFCSPHIGHO2_02_FULL_50_50]|uniref:M23ase beta-sheet core domain-containing protein n=1 Tax=Candidatus Kaiserbacteria bacterium RIFCSPHIGHO2_02_FULL_50_50 TaxID=1798492 RepID=A0A1F6DC83_9BACT|nr:MAG: hypothetical protein A3C89_03580 [Candidatus Kaiserbacteria bacterium RIFCSPHIGHO2_02_FULL_50_50]OGG88541.1 MAG: hypothetical protein A3G62_03470 [Candidatus Kaiserbacteria bacterium RIFCSPLOWO2_12_FULL_50_10]